MTNPAHDTTVAPAPAITVLLERVRRGDDKSSLDELLRRIQPRVESWIRRERGRAIRHRAETVDLRQDVLWELTEYLPRVEARDSKGLERLLHRIVQNTVRDAFEALMRERRRITRERPLAGGIVLQLDAPDASMKAPDEIAERHEQEAWLRLALALLRAEDEILFLKRRYQLVPYSELAEELGSTEDALRMRCARIQARLAKSIRLLKEGRIVRAFSRGAEVGVAVEA